MKLIHHSPLGAIHIGGVAGAVEPGVPFEIPDALAEGLLRQSGLYQVAGEPKAKPSDRTVSTVAENEE